MAEIPFDLSATDGSNIARWPENMQFRNVNNAGRADEGMLARWAKDLDYSVTSSGSANAYAATSNRTIAALTNNTVIAFTANFTNTGASTFAFNGLTAKAIKRPNGDALEASDILSGQPMALVYKSSPEVWFLVTPPGRAGAAASDTLTGQIEIAVQSEMEAAASAVLAVTPGRQHFHPGHPKATVHFGVSANILNDYGVTSVTDSGTGAATVTLDTAHSAADVMKCHVSVEAGAVNVNLGGFVSYINAIATTTVSVRGQNPEVDALEDPTSWFLTVLGDFA